MPLSPAGPGGNLPSSVQQREGVAAGRGQCEFNQLLDTFFLGVWLQYSDPSQPTVVSFWMELHFLRWYRLVVPSGLDQLSRFAADLKHLSCILKGKIIPFPWGNGHKQADTSHSDELMSNSRVARCEKIRYIPYGSLWLFDTWKPWPHIAHSFFSSVGAV